MASIHAFIPLMLLSGACQAPPDERQFMPGADADRGLALIGRAGCAACHTIPGVGWPRGTAGPALEGFADRARIAGRLPNRPEILAAFVRDAPASLPGTTMPSMPLSPQESRDVAAYLYTLGDR